MSSGQTGGGEARERERERERESWQYPAIGEYRWNLDDVLRCVCHLVSRRVSKKRGSHNAPRMIINEICARGDPLRRRRPRINSTRTRSTFNNRTWNRELISFLDLRPRFGEPGVIISVIRRVTCLCVCVSVCEKTRVLGDIRTKEWLMKSETQFC